ncbi:hypothetical protein [Tautonia plasticadhaerens]|uniref:Uncharacterized protein n=1 Tax=Tautonia plasticadhaerens TaxID=2527974 RepID=A0A518H2C2_9BACT|nr:hypothetical protein [Tautonia plasticadhaerens]QDV35001.1 hypothetical protein ElP_28980 [Tautonia plasticadhaerens]
MLVNINQPTSPEIHNLSIRLARECRYVVQGCLREEEWSLCDQEFYRVIRSGLEELARKEKP